MVDRSRLNNRSRINKIRYVADGLIGGTGTWRCATFSEFGPLVPALLLKTPPFLALAISLHINKIRVISAGPRPPGYHFRACPRKTSQNCRGTLSKLSGMRLSYQQQGGELSGRRRRISVAMAGSFKSVHGSTFSGSCSRSPWGAEKRCDAAHSVRGVPARVGWRRGLREECGRRRHCMRARGARCPRRRPRSSTRRAS